MLAKLAEAARTGSLATGKETNLYRFKNVTVHGFRSSFRDWAGGGALP